MYPLCISIVKVFQTSVNYENDRNNTFCTATSNDTAELEKPLTCKFKQFPEQ